MSKALFDHGGLRFFDEAEIVRRENIIRYLAVRVPMLLRKANAAWDVRRVEGPTLIPSYLISQEHLQTDDVYLTQIPCGAHPHRFALRAETTASTYAYMREFLTNTNDYNAKLPLCVYQVGKSYRTEKSDGATAAKLRYNEFYQMEFQCAYSSSTKKDYFDLLPDLARVLESQIDNFVVEVVESDRLPSYSKKTMDLVARHYYPGGYEEFELASVSKRTDFGDDIEVFEIAIGLDRVLALGA